MVPDASRPAGPWQGRVRFAPGGGFAYRPREVLVRSEVADQAESVLRNWAEEETAGKYQPFAIERQERPVAGAFVRFVGDFEPVNAIDRLHSVGILAQVNHVLFATGCCPPHPSGSMANPFYANPFYANPFYANPFYANPFYANPFYANANACGCGCGGGGAGANPFYANPFYANADPSPFAVPWLQPTGDRRSSARPAEAPSASAGTAAPGVRIAILDTGWATASYAPDGLPGISAQGDDHPDEGGDGFLDPAAGHGTFIAGIIERLAPGAHLTVIPVLSGYGDGDESEIADELWDLAELPDAERPQLVNLSFGGYSPQGMGPLAHAVSRLHAEGAAVVASAGNDATCTPMYPAVLPAVVGVAALDNEDKAAPFTNYGPWVRACTAGVDVTSIFFKGFNGAEPPVGGDDPDDFKGWAVWSGTSFAAPRVVAALAQKVAAGTSPHEAVRHLVDDPALPRKPMLGTVVDPM